MAERMFTTRRNAAHHTNRYRPCCITYEFLFITGTVMRKITALLFACLLIPQLLAAQEEDVPVASTGEGVQQVLVPKEVFVGDSAQINYTFRSAVDFFA